MCSIISGLAYGSVYVQEAIMSILWSLLFELLSICQPIKRKKEGEEKRMTQEEMLLEAAQTGSFQFLLK